MRDQLHKIEIRSKGGATAIRLDGQLIKGLENYSVRKRGGLTVLTVDIVAEDVEMLFDDGRRNEKPMEHIYDIGKRGKVVTNAKIPPKKTGEYKGMCEAPKAPFSLKDDERDKKMNEIYPVGYMGIFTSDPNENEVLIGTWEKSGEVWKRIE